MVLIVGIIIGVIFQLGFTIWRNRSKRNLVGTMSLTPTESGGKMFTLEVNGDIDLDDLDKMDEVTFKVISGAQ